MDFQTAYRLLKSKNQLQLLQYYDFLTQEEKVNLLGDIAKIDFSILSHLTEGKRAIGDISPVKAVTLAQMNENRTQYAKVGKQAVQQGKVGAVVLAGGMGSRLGCEGAKGVFNMGLTRELSIFELQMRNLKDVCLECGVSIPLFVMTSESTDLQTRTFFAERDYFGYDKNDVYFYTQKVAPACDLQGKILLEDKDKVAFAPNGNGGWYSSLVENGLDKVLQKRGIEWLNIYAVDNVLQRMCDTAFIGATLQSDCDCGAKVVVKNCPEERVGVLCMEGGKPTIVEYYEMPADLAAQMDENGNLKYGYGVILNYLFRVEKLNQTVCQTLPYHLAKKAIPYYDNGFVYPEKPNGYKFEQLAVDLVGVMGSCLAVEVDREREFAPVKNKTGIDSVESARAMLVKNGVTL